MSSSLVIVLGPPGAGKTALGSAVCSRLGLRFLDLPEDSPSGADAIEAGVDGADVVALPWQLQGEAGVLRAVRKLGTTIALWAHPETLQERARQPVSFTPRRGLVTHGGFGRRGKSCVEFRRLERACHFTLDLDGLTQAQAVEELAAAIVELRTQSGPVARLEARREQIEAQIHEDVGGRHRPAVSVLADAMARFLLSREQAGASPRTLGALGSDLHAAAVLVFEYASKTDERILDEFARGAPCVAEYRRKLSYSPALEARYAASLQAFSEFLASMRAEASDADRSEDP